MMKRGRMQHHPESTRDKLQRYKGVIVVVSLPIILIILVLFMMPRPTDDGFSPVGKKYRKIDSGTNSVGNRYAVIFDAGSSGSRVHVFCFDKNLDLVHIGNDLELFDALKPGLSAYAASPQDAARSLVPLLEKAEKVVPKDQRGVTPVKVGATAGLRALEGDAPDRILQAVRDLLKDKSDFKSESDWVTVLDGTQEGAYQWVTVNYLLGYVGQPYSGTVGVVDLGGGSVQMAYAISDSDAANAPTVTGGQDSYVKDMYLRGQKYHLYIHSYLRYGLLAARAEILKVVGDASNPCILAGYQGTYKYGGDDYKVAASPMGGNVEECKVMARRALKINESTCTHMKCTFNGVWNGGGGDGQKNLFVASFFFDRAAEAGFIDPKKPVAEVRPSQFADAAKKACETKLDEGKAKYPDAEEGNLPYLCMDLTYQYVLLVDGFGLDPSQSMTLVKRVPYRDSQVEAAWPLGSAIEAMSALA